MDQASSMCHSQQALEHRTHEHIHSFDLLEEDRILQQMLVLDAQAARVSIFHGPFKRPHPTVVNEDRCLALGPDRIDQLVKDLPNIGGIFLNFSRKVRLLMA